MPLTSAFFDSLPSLNPPSPHSPSPDYINPWWIWGYWMSPLSYAQNALALNEFLAPRWQVVSPESTPATIGNAVLASRAFITDPHFMDVAFAALVGLSLVFNLVTVVALATLHRKPARFRS